MKRIALVLALVSAVAGAQDTTTPPKPAPKTTTAKPATPAKSATGTKTAATAKSASTAKSGTAAAAHHPAAAAGPHVPANIPQHTGPTKPLFSLLYQDITIGSGPLAEPLKLYKVKYTGWLASDGTKFDSSDDHRQPLNDKDGKPILDADGKQKLGDPQPIMFPQGRGRVIPGWDQGFEGMHVGGKRRLFIPYQLAYGAAGRPPKIPAKSDLIFDVELVDITDMPAPPMPGGPGGRPMPGLPSRPTPPPSPGSPAAPATPGSSAAPSSSSPSSPSAPATTPAPATAAPTTPPVEKPVNPEQPK
jgi:peptidylprolyl isomerase